MSSQLIVPATEYTPLPKERFSTHSYVWSVGPKKPTLHVKEQLPQRDWDQLYAMWESTENMIASQRYPDQDDFKNVKRQMGKSMHSNELVRKITRLNSNLVSQDSVSMKGNAAFYYVNPDKSLKYTNASYEIGIVPEFTIMRTDTADLPSYYPRYGWRTVLVRLLKGQYLSWDSVIKTFGDVEHLDSRGLHWWMNVRNFKG